jgi:hypothetical protein
MSSEFDREPIRGLPAHLPKGEHILWQGAPAWRSLAIRAFHARTVAIYLAIMLSWAVYANFAESLQIGTALISVAPLFVIAAASVGFLVFMAWATARSTVYTITNRRIVMRFGVALPMTVNLPFKIVGSAALRLHPNGDGDIPLALATNDRLAFLVLWPHARPWRATRPEPMLRCIPEAEQVAGLVARALSTADPAGQADVPKVRHADAPVPQPQAA